METALGTSAIAAVTLLLESAALVAVTVMVWAAEIVAGAVYTPLDKVPTDGDMDQVTLVLLDPVTVATKVEDFPPVSDAEVGETVIATGTKDIAAVALLLVSAALTAFTEMVCAEAIVAGAV